MSESNHVYRVTEIVGTSTDGLESAINNGLARAASTLRGLDWFEVTELRGKVGEGEVEYYQVAMKVGFRLDA